MPPSYIIAVNASIVSDSGGTCVCPGPTAPGDVPCLNDTAYLLCKEEIKKDLITTTAAISAFGSFFMGLCANLYVQTATQTHCWQSNAHKDIPLMPLLFPSR